MGGENFPDNSGLVTEADPGAAVEVQRPERVVLHVQLERDQAAGPEFGGAGGKRRPARLGGEVVDDDGLLGPDGIQARALAELVLGLVAQGHQLVGGHLREDLPAMHLRDAARDHAGHGGHRRGHNPGQGLVLVAFGFQIAGHLTEHLREVVAAPLI